MYAYCGVFCCQKCRAKCNGTTLYICKNKHVFCESCFHHFVYEAHKQLKCPQCGLPITAVSNRNEIKSANSRTLNSHRTSAASAKKRSLNTISSNDIRLPDTGSNTPWPTRSSMSTSCGGHPLANVSKRPIYCPTTDCSKMIAVTSLILHYSFDHAKTPQECVEFNKPRYLSLHLNNMKFGKTQCIALFLIGEDNVPDPQLRNHGISFPLLVARMSCIPVTREDAESAEINFSPVPDKLQFNDGDVIMLWVCGNIDKEISCLMEVSDEEKARVFSYRGPINSMRCDNRPESVFKRSDCLIIHSSAVRNITRDGKLPVELKLQLCNG